MELNHTWNSRRAAAYGFVAAYVFAFAASKSLGFLPGYALDDYAVASGGGADAFVHQFISQGRFAFAALQSLLLDARLSMLDFHPLALVGIAFFSGMMFSSMLCVSEKDSRVTTVLVAALLGAHPYMTEYVTFRQAALPMALMFFFLWLAFRNYLEWRNGALKGFTRPLLAISFATIAVGFNQLALSFFCIGLLFYSARSTINSSDSLGRQWWKSLALAAGGGIVVSAAYFAAADLVRTVFEVPANSRAVMIHGADLPARASQLLELIGKIMWGSETIAAPASKFALLIATVAWVFQTPWAKWPRAAYAALLFTVATALALFPIALSATWWPVPRTLIVVPFAFAGTIMMVPQRPGVYPVLPSIAALAIAVLLFCAHSTAMLTNQLRLNRWDIATARDIFLATSQQFPQRRGAIVLNSPKWAFPAAPSIAEGDLNVSALSIGWSIAPLFQEATGRAVDVRSSTMFDADCIGRGAFPASTAIFRHKDDVIVCM